MPVTDGYLLDTNTITYLANPSDKQHNIVKEKMSEVAENAPVMLPVITIAEIEFGIVKAGPGIAEDQRQALRNFFAAYPLHLGIDDNTIEPYSLIRAQLWKLYATSSKRGHKEKLPEELIDKVTGKELGIDERDLLIASVAVQYGLVLVTADKNKKMQRIIEAAVQLKVQGKNINLYVTD